MVAASKESKLLRIQIEPTNRCNFRCVYCRRTHWTRPEGDMSLEHFLTLLDRLPAAQCIHLQGVGEPLLNRKLPEMVRYTRSRNIRTGTSTNASLLNTRTAKVLLDAGINRINLSIDTLDPEEFGRIRPGVTLERILVNIATIAKVRHSGGYMETELALAVVAGPSNTAHLDEIIELAASLGLDEVYLQNLNRVFLPAGHPAERKISEKESDHYREAKHTAEALASRLGIRFLAPVLDSPDFYSRCQWPFSGCNITWDGFVAPCCLQPDPAVMHFGNLFETDFGQIWHSPAYRNFRSRVLADCETLCERCPERYGQMWHPDAAPFPKSKSLPSSTHETC